MHRKLKKLFRLTHTITLSPEEKNKLREEVFLFVKKHPVRNAAAHRQLLQERSHGFVFTKLGRVYTKLQFTPMIIVLIIALLAGGGTSFAADNALPGDALYSVKIHVNEEVRGWLAVSDISQAEWDARRAERRLEEAEKLAVDGKLDAQTRADLEALFTKFAQAFQERAEKIATKQGTQAAFETHSNFEASLKAHEKVLLQLVDDEDEDSDDDDVDVLLIEVRSHLKITEQKRNDDEEEISDENDHDVQTAAEGKLKAAENKIREVRAFLSKITDSISVNAVTQAEAKLKLAEEVIARGKTEMEAGNYGKAFSSFQEAHRMSQEAQLILAAEKRIHIEIKDLDDDDKEDSHEENHKEESGHRNEKDDDDEKNNEGHEEGSQTQSIKIHGEESMNLNLGL